MSQSHLLTKLIRLTLLKEKITGEVPWKQWLPLVLILKKVCEGLCFSYPSCIALGAAMLGDKKFFWTFCWALSEFDDMYVLGLWLRTKIFISFNTIVFFIITVIVIVIIVFSNCYYYYCYFCICYQWDNNYCYSCHNTNITSYQI